MTASHDTVSRSAESPEVDRAIVPTGLSDTDADSLRIQIELLRRATPGRRAALALALSADVMTLSLAGIRRRNPGVSKTDAGTAFVASITGLNWPKRSAPG